MLIRVSQAAGKGGEGEAHTHLQTRLTHQILFLILGGIWVLQVGHEPGAELIRCLLGQIASAFPLLRISAHAHITIA